jgi:hypothetical protein
VNADPDPGARKLTNILTNKPEFQSFKKAFVPVPTGIAFIKIFFIKKSTFFVTEVKSWIRVRI